MRMTCPSKTTRKTMQKVCNARADKTVDHPHVKCITITPGMHSEQDVMQFQLGCADNQVNAGGFVAQRWQECTS